MTDVEANSPNSNVAATAPSHYTVPYTSDNGVGTEATPSTARFNPGGDVEDPQEEPLESLPARTANGGRWRLQLTTIMGNNAVHYPPRFKALGAVVLGLSLTWVGNYLLEVLPTINEHQDSPCKYNDNQLSHNAKMLFVYFIWFAVARVLLFVPCVAARVAVVQSRTHGFCKTYMVHLVLRDGPLYIFVVGSLLFWFHLMQSPNCEEMSPELYRTLKLYAINSCLLSIFCLVLAYWHNKLLVDAMREIYEQGDFGEGPAFPSAGAPPDTMASLESKTYDPDVFGDEEGKLYPAECAICLINWEPEEVIKITPCGHAFHEECLSNWLKTARTCALCRQDVSRDGGARILSGSATQSLQPSAQYIGATHPPDLGDVAAEPPAVPASMNSSVAMPAAALPASAASVEITSTDSSAADSAISSQLQATAASTNIPTNDMEDLDHPGSARTD